MKKFLSLVLSLVLFLSLAAPAITAQAADVSCPTIYVPGFAGSTIYTDKSDPSTKATYPTVDELLEIVKKDLLPALLTYLATDNGDPFAYEFTELLNYIFEDYFNNPDGTAKGNAGTYMPYPSKVGKTAQLTFSYDWRGDPVEIAEELNSYINYVCEKSGSDKVALQCHSLGSVIITAYLRLYGNSKVMGIVFDSPALEGITYVGELLCGNTEFTGEALATGIKGLLGENEYNELISGVLDILGVAGITDDAAGFLDELVKKTAPILYTETLVPLFGCWPATWALTPDRYVDGATDYIFTTYMNGEEYDALKAKIAKYNTDIRPYKKDTLLDFDKSGRVAVIARYGYAGLPVSPLWTVGSDTVVDVASASFGATVAPYGTTFTEEELSGKDMSLISPDGTVDASTCLFPDKTWFIKNITHDKTSITKPMRLELLFGEEEATIQNSDYARFMIYDAETETVSEDKGECKIPAEENETATLLVRIMKFFTAILNLFTKLFKK